MTSAPVLLGQLLMLISLPLSSIAMPVDSIRPIRDGCRSKAACIGTGTLFGHVPLRTAVGRPMLLFKR
jgi:hypothetical protein